MRTFPLRLALLPLTFVAIEAHAQTTDVARFSFSGTVAAPLNSVTATTGTGTGSLIGFEYGGNTASGDVTPTTGDPNPLSQGSTYRGRNAAGGWSLGAPQYSQGFQFNASTVGYSAIKLDFDWFTTTQGIRNMQVDYTTDGVTWNHYQGAVAGVATTKDAMGDTQLIATSNGFNTVGAGAALNEIDLSGIVAAANNAKFGVRLVSALDATNGGYASAAWTGSGTFVPYNGTSGNWRVDQVAIRGVQAVPEPGTLAALSLGGLVLLRRRRR